MTISMKELILNLMWQPILWIRFQGEIRAQIKSQESKVKHKLDGDIMKNMILKKAVKENAPRGWITRLKHQRMKAIEDEMARAKEESEE